MNGMSQLLLAADKHDQEKAKPFKRFLLFAYSKHGALGGMNDLKGSFDNIETLAAHFYAHHETDENYQHGHYYDQETRKIHSIQ